MSEQTTISKFKPSTEEQYYEMLGALPPAAYFSNGFLLGEPINHRRCTISNTYAPVYDAYLEHKGQYYVSKYPVTICEAQEFTVADI